jgi:hypothetical protein
MNDTQLADRFAAIELPPWRDDVALAASFRSILPSQLPSQLREADVRRRILALTNGITVSIFRLVEIAAIRAN